MKTLHNSDASGTRTNVADVKFFGSGEEWQLICKASSEAEGWMKSTKAMEVPGGVLIQTSTQQRNADLTYSLCDALCFVPGARITASGDDQSGIVARHLTPLKSTH